MPSSLALEQVVQIINIVFWNDYETNIYFEE
jgi:hypothetical protein